MPKDWINDKKEFLPLSYPGNENNVSRRARAIIRNLSLKNGIRFKENENYIDFKFLIKRKNREIIARFALERIEQVVSPRDCKQKKNRDGTFLASEKGLSGCSMNELGKEILNKLGIQDNQKKCNDFYKKCPLPKS